jgi:hypothetical protein
MHFLQDYNTPFIAHRYSFLNERWGHLIPSFDPMTTLLGLMTLHVIDPVMLLCLVVDLVIDLVTNYNARYNR